MSKIHFGYVHHNPGNIRWNPRDKWQGLAQTIPAHAPPQPGRYDATLNGVRFVPNWDRTGVGFFVFDDATMGLRAIARTLITYQDKYGDRSIYDLFKRYAPPGDHANDPAAYAAHVAKLTGLPTPYSSVNAHEYRVLRAMLPAICRVETGMAPPYTDAQFDKALVLAGVSPPEKPITSTRTVKGAGTVTAGGVVNQGAADATDAAKDLGKATDAQWLVDLGNQLLPVLKWVGVALVVAGIAWIVWARLDDRRKGLR